MGAGGRREGPVSGTIDFCFFLNWRVLPSFRRVRHTVHLQEEQKTHGTFHTNLGKG